MTKIRLNKTHKSEIRRSFLDFCTKKIDFESIINKNFEEISKSVKDLAFKVQQIEHNSEVEEFLTKNNILRESDTIGIYPKDFDKWILNPSIIVRDWVVPSLTYRTLCNFDLTDDKIQEIIKTLNDNKYYIDVNYNSLMDLVRKYGEYLWTTVLKSTDIEEQIEKVKKIFESGEAIINDVKNTDQILEVFGNIPAINSYITEITHNSSTQLQVVSNADVDIVKGFIEKNSVDNFEK